MFKPLSSRKPLAAAAFVLLTGFAGAAAAAPILISGGGPGSESNLGFFTGSLSYVATDAANATLTVSLTNTSPLANGGFLTGFAFNNPGDLISGVSLTASDADFNLLGGPDFDNDVNASPHGDFDIAASLAPANNNYNGGGTPSDGLAVGATGTFTFSLTGLLLDTLTEQSFVDELSDNGLFFTARFRGFEDDGSDKVPANVVPVPAAAWLFGSALAGLVGWTRRRT